MPSTKVTTQSVTSVIMAIITAVALHVFGAELSGEVTMFIAGIVGWAVGGVAAYAAPETRPAPSTLAALSSSRR